MAIALGVIFEPLGQVVAYQAWQFLAYTIRTVDSVSRMIGGVVTLGGIMLGCVVLQYTILFLATGWMSTAAMPS